MLRHLIAISKPLAKLARYQIAMKTPIATTLKLGSFARGKLDTTTTTKGNNKMGYKMSDVFNPLAIIGGREIDSKSQELGK